jgi:hypothetical protein
MFQELELWIKESLIEQRGFADLGKFGSPYLLRMMQVSLSASVGSVPSAFT